MVSFGRAGNVGDWKEVGDWRRYVAVGSTVKAAGMAVNRNSEVSSNSSHVIEVNSRIVKSKEHI